MTEFDMIAASISIEVGSPAVEADITVCSGPRSRDRTSIREAISRVPACRETFDVACWFLRRNQGSAIDRVSS